MRKLFILGFLVFCFSLGAHAQPRPIDRAVATPNASETFEARYEGGTFGASRKETGTLRFDDANQRVVFYRKDNKEMFAIPYETLMSIYPDSKTSVSKTGNVVSRLPLPGAGMAGLLSKSSKYVVISFDDPDIEVRGAANFKFGERDRLLAFIDSLGTRAKMVRRGDAFYRSRDSSIY